MFFTNESLCISYRTQNDLEATREEIQLQQTELSRLRHQLSQNEQNRLQLENELNQSKRYSQQLEQQISTKDQSMKNNDLLLDQFRQQLTIVKKDSESSELNTRRKTDELNRSRQAVLDRTRDEYEKLLRKYTDLDEVYRELVGLREQELCKKFPSLFFSIFLRSLQQNRK